jgi:probable dihydroxyacetone kinase regulator
MKTKELLADSFRELVLTMPFQKISIKMITDKAGVIRPTFYNYFQDKYEVIEYLFAQDIAGPVEMMLKNGMEPEAIRLLFLCFEKNMKYYRNLFDIEGQNSFAEYFDKYIHDTYLHILAHHPMKHFSSALITPDVLAHFNSLILSEMIKLWIHHTPAVSAEEMYETYRIFLRTSALDYIDYPS